MRFAAVTMPARTEPQRSPAAEFVRRLVTGEKLQGAPAEPRPSDPPLDLDQRVRLAGEW
jgi:hypothetical protein